MPRTRRGRAASGRIRCPGYLGFRVVSNRRSDRESSRVVLPPGDGSTAQRLARRPSCPRRSRSRAVTDTRVHLSRPPAHGLARQPAARRARSRRPAESTSCLLCRHGTAVWLVLSEPCEGEIYAEIPLDPLLQPDRRPLARPRRRPARGVLLRLPGRRPQGQRPSLRSPDHPASTRTRGRCLAAGPGATGQPAAPQLDDRIDDRPAARRQSPHAPGRHDHLRTARSRLHDRPELGRPPSRDLCRVSPRRSTSSRSWGSPPSSCCRSTSSTRTTARSSIR